MRKNILTFFLLFLLFPLFNLHAERVIFKVKVDTEDIHAKPNSNSMVLGYINEGDYIFTDSEKIKNGWVPVKVGDKVGYVRLKALTDVTPHGFKENIKFYFNYFMEEYFFATLLILIVLGTILGLTRAVIVFRDYQDVAKCGALIVVPFAVAILWTRIALIFNSKAVTYIFLIIIAGAELYLLGSIVVNTYKDNGGSILKTFLALITKIPLTILFTLAVLEVFTPGERKKKEDKTDFIAILLLLLPLIYGLVQHKVWKFTGQEEEKSSLGEVTDTLKPKV